MKKLIIGAIVTLLLVACSPTPQNNSNIITPPSSNDSTNNSSQNDGEFVYSVDNVRDFELDIELLNGRDIEYDYRANEGEVIDLLNHIEINLERTLNEMMEDVLNHLDISRDDVNEFQLQVEFNDFKEIEFNYNQEATEEDREVVDFNLEIDYKDRSEWNFEYELNEDYEVEGKENLKDSDAKTRIDALIDVLDISMDKSLNEIASAFMNHLEINRDQVESFDLDIEYRDASEIDVKVHY